MIRLDFEPIPDTRFAASMQPVVPGMRMLRSSFSPGFTFRDDDLVKDGLSLSWENRERLGNVAIRAPRQKNAEAVGPTQEGLRVSVLIVA